VKLIGVLKAADLFSFLLLVQDEVRRVEGDQAIDFSRLVCYYGRDSFSRGNLWGPRGTRIQVLEVEIRS
jgi:hypothetical protein